MAERYEFVLGRYADQNLTVSRAFKKDLETRFGLEPKRVHVLYDRAVRGKFGPISIQTKHELFGRVGMQDRFTEVDADGKVRAQESRPILMLTSTSYTPDEDLGMLVDALNKYCRKAIIDPKLPKIFLIVTGAGPLKKQFLATFAEFNQTEHAVKAGVEIHAKWLEIDDYPLMVAAADIGICLHLSSSNLDLPMKVVDMFSCKVPCFAFDYPTIGELVKSKCRGEEHPTGALFKTSEELLSLLVGHLGEGVEKAVSNLEEYRKNLDSFVSQTWECHWQEVMLSSVVCELPGIKQQKTD